MVMTRSSASKQQARAQLERARVEGIKMEEMERRIYGYSPEPVKLEHGLGRLLQEQVQDIMSRELSRDLFKTGAYDQDDLDRALSYTRTKRKGGSQISASQSDNSYSQTTSVPVARGRGRPRKVKIE